MTEQLLNDCLMMERLVSFRFNYEIKKHRGGQGELCLI